MKVTWLGHSCFKVESQGFTVILDPYGPDTVPGLRPLEEKAHLVLCSHEHFDHNSRTSVELLPEVPSPFTVTRLATYHDDCQGTQRGENTIHILDDGRTRLAHFGDLGCPLTPDQLVALRDLDVALIPVGGFYTIDSRQAAALAAQVKPRVTVPMHFRDDEAGFGFDAISTVEEFASLLSPTVFLEGSLLDTEDLPDAAAAVLRPRYGR